MKKCCFILFSFFYAMSFGQGNNTLYFLPEVYQSRLLNPGFGQICRGYIGLPVVNSVFVNVNSNTLSYNKIFSESTKDKPHMLDPDILIKRLSKRNYLMTDVNVSLLSLGFRRKSSFLSFDAIERVEASVGIPRDLLRLAWYGNGNIPNIRIQGLGVNATYFREFTLGYSRVFDEYLSYGLRFRILFGLLNLNTTHSTINLQTNPDDYSLSLTSDILINSSLPVTVQENTASFLPTIAFDPSFPNVNTFLNFKNYGFALDLGSVYNIAGNLNIFASITDLGFIRWNTNPNGLMQNGQVLYEGPAMGFSNLQFEGYFDSMLDSLLNQFDISTNTKNYFTFRPVKIYLGAEYFLHQKISVSLLHRSMIYKYGLFPNFTAGIKFKPFGFTSVVLSYSIINRSFNNAGLGLYVGRRGLQLYAVSDNLTGFIWPMSSQYFDIRFGANLYFGCKEKRKAEKITKKEINALGCGLARQKNLDEIRKKTGKYLRKKYGIKEIY